MEFIYFALRLSVFIALAAPILIVFLLLMAFVDRSYDDD